LHVVRIVRPMRLRKADEAVSYYYAAGALLRSANVGV
jgi:hypothetical protein